MMKFEYDKLEIPEKYRKMSVSELTMEKEKIYQTISTQKTEGTRKKMSGDSVHFNF